MQKEKNYLFKKSLVPRIFFIIISLALVLSLNVSNKKQDHPAVDASGNIICGSCNIIDRDKLCSLNIKPQEIKELTLFVDETCPYSARVTSFAKNEKMAICVKNITRDKSALHELSSLTGGKVQVPCLKLGDSCYMYESSDIIRQLRHVKRECPILLTQQEHKESAVAEPVALTPTNQVETAINT